MRDRSLTRKKCIQPPSTRIQTPIYALVSHNVGSQQQLSSLLPRLLPFHCCSSCESVSVLQRIRLFVFRGCSCSDASSDLVPRETHRPSIIIIIFFFFFFFNHGSRIPSQPMVSLEDNNCRVLAPAIPVGERTNNNHPIFDRGH